MKNKIISLREDSDFKLLGISSKLSMYKISWLLNQHLNFNFHRLDEIDENATDKLFSVYQYENTHAIFSLIENKSCEGQFLLKKLNNIDYLLKIEGNFIHIDLDQIIKKIRQIKKIYACLIIELSLLKKKDLDLLA